MLIGTFGNGNNIKPSIILTDLQFQFLPRCMERSRGIAMGILSVRLSVKRVHCDKTEESYV